MISLSIKLSGIEREHWITRGSKIPREESYLLRYNEGQVQVEFAVQWPRPGAGGPRADQPDGDAPSHGSLPVHHVILLLEGREAQGARRVSPISSCNSSPPGRVSVSMNCGFPSILRLARDEWADCWLVLFDWAKKWIITWKFGALYLSLAH